jgi:hypothetical protein
MIPTFRGLSPIDPDEADDFSGITDLLLDAFPFGEKLLIPFKVKRFSRFSHLHRSLRAIEQSPQAS